MTATKARVFISSAQDLEAMSSHLSKALELPAFYTKSDFDPPHSITAMTGSLGHDVWLRESTLDGQQGFELEFETTMSPGDHFNANFSDLSDWFAKHLQIVADLDCRPAPRS
jgi:hypothetical protein